MAKDFSLKSLLISLYHGARRRSRIFRNGLLIFDISTILFFIISTFFEDFWWIRGIEYVVTLVIVLDLVARFYISPNRLNFFGQLTTWTDLIVVVTLLIPALIENFTFLRVLRALRLLRTYHTLAELRSRYAFFKRNEEIVQSVVNLGVFIFIVTALVYVLQLRTNPQINNYIDALYFTVTTLTTTGFGDITLQGSSGRLIAVLIMIIGVALFLRLIQTIFRPAKVRFRCRQCGLTRHEMDAVHCKHCGEVLNIETEGMV